MMNHIKVQSLRKVPSIVPGNLMLVLLSVVDEGVPYMAEKFGMTDHYYL